MTCVCGHSDDVHDIDDEQTVCTLCQCDEFCEDIDEDELEEE